MRRLNKKALLDYLESDAPEDKKREVAELVEAYDKLLAANPLEGFEPHPCRFCKRLGPNPACQRHRTPQADFLAAYAKVVAAFAGNQFGKTTALVVKLLVQHAPRELLPEHLLPYRFTPFDVPVFGRLYVPSEKALIEYTIPTLQQWTPKDMLLGGTWNKAWEKQHNILRFKAGLGQLGVYTYQQDPATMVGAKLHYAGYDEPPPKEIRRETLPRLIYHNGPEFFALTPVNIKGGGIGWLFRDIWKRRDDPDKVVIKASIWDNPLLPPEAVEHALSQYPEEERRAREEGDFLHLGGVVYQNGFEDDLCDPPSAEHVQGLDNVVGIDPGIRNAAFVFKCFDDDNVALAYDELLLESATVADYAVAVALKMAKWGLRGEVRWHAEQILRERYAKDMVSLEDFEGQIAQLAQPAEGPEPTFVIDPSARNRSLTDGETVEDALRRFGIRCIHGYNNVPGGVAQIRLRRQHGYFLVSRECKGLRGEAEEYRQEDREDGEFKIVKENDHRMDADRYATTVRPFIPPERPARIQVARPWGVATPPPRVHEAVAPTGSMT